MGIVRYNPYTGQLRDPRDIETDPTGLLITDKNAPLRSASSQPLEQFRERLEIMKKNGHVWLTITAILQLLSSCEYREQENLGPG